MFLCCFAFSFVVATSLPASISTEPKIGDFSHLMIQFGIDPPKLNSIIKQYPHEKWCRYYYNWETDDIFTVRECPKGEIFDYHHHQCQNKTSAQCWSDRYGKTKVHDHIHSKWRKHFRCPFSTGKYPDVFDCDKFILCEDGKAKHKKCHHFKQFDRILRRCVSEEVAICADESDAEDISHRCPKSSGNVGHPKDCSKYFHCRKGKAHLKKCKEGTLFHEKHQKCMNMNKVHCNHGYKPYEKETTPTESESVSKITAILDVYDEPKEVLKDSLSKPNKNNIDLVLVESVVTEENHKVSELPLQTSTMKEVATANSTQIEVKISTDVVNTEEEFVPFLNNTKNT